jgi:hypothetical protein
MRQKMEYIINKVDMTKTAQGNFSIIRAVALLSRTSMDLT